MARAKKNTVDYFPHNCIHGKTLKIFESKFIHGYKFWFKLLELLGNSPDHYYDCKPDIDRLWLVETCLGVGNGGVQETSEMLDYLAKLKAIDPDLWRADRIIWSQNFVDNLETVYNKRSTDIPKRPIGHGNPAQEVIPSRIEPIKEINSPETPQSKVKESIEKESIVCARDHGKTLKAKMDLFLIAWRKYNKKQDRKKAVDIWLKLSIKDMNKCISKIDPYVKSTPEVQYRKMFKTYIHNRSWENDIIRPDGKVYREVEKYEYECFNCGGTFYFQQRGNHRCKNNDCKIEREDQSSIGYALDYVQPIFKEDKNV